MNHINLKLVLRLDRRSKISLIIKDRWLEKLLDIYLSSFKISINFNDCYFYTNKYI